MNCRTVQQKVPNLQAARHNSGINEALTVKKHIKVIVCLSETGKGCCSAMPSIEKEPEHQARAISVNVSEDRTHKHKCIEVGVVRFAPNIPRVSFNFEALSKVNVSPQRCVCGGSGVHAEDIQYEMLLHERTLEMFVCLSLSNSMNST